MVTERAARVSAQAGLPRGWRSCLAAGLVIVSLVVTLTSGPLSADVYKYVDKQGNVFFSDEPLTSTGLKLEWKRTATRLAAQNREQSASIRRKQAQVNARLEAQSKAEAAAAEIYKQRPAKPVNGSMWVRRMRYQPLIDSAARRHGLVPELLHAVIRTESAYKPDALSHAPELVG